MTLTTRMTLCIKTGPVIVMKVGQPVNGLLHLMTGHRDALFVADQLVDQLDARPHTPCIFGCGSMPWLVSFELCLLRFVGLHIGVAEHDDSGFKSRRGVSGFRVFAGLALWWRWVQGFEGVGVRV